jgi:AcrR family transcriptional regulator
MGDETGLATGLLSEGGPDADDDLIRLGRDAEGTRRALVRAARRRFATDGYQATTVRQIAADAGVNVALINRYFVSKEGLFQACMLRTSDELDSEPSPKSGDLDALVARLLAHVVNAPDRDDPLLLLLRSSGEDDADEVRRRTLEHFTEKLAAAAGWRPEEPATGPVLLRAQLAIATALGVVMLRTSAVQPLQSALAEDLERPLGEVFRALLAFDD